MFIVEFVDNNSVLAFINVLFFYANRGFHFYMSFNSNIIDYIVTRKRLNAIKIKNIIDYMQDIFIFIRDKFNRAQLIIIE